MYAGLPPREEQAQQGAEMRQTETEQLPLFNDISASVEKKTQE